jgi:parallel beta-helix repeat protein/predicted outer membrane repeat protein
MGELRITDDVAIEGPGAELLTIDASGNDSTPDINDGMGSRIFQINDEDRSIHQSTVVSRLALTGGDSPASSGAIYASEKLSLLDVHFFKNHTLGSGGAINVLLWDSVEVIIDNCIFDDNEAFLDGGAIYALAIANGRITVLDNAIAGNKARQNGGGIYVAGSTATTLIEGNLISGNSGYGGLSDGGGIFVSGATALIENNLISLNSAFRGGGVYVGTRDAAIQRSSVRENSAFNGAGIYAPRSLTSQTLLISDSTIADNTAVWYAGGISVSGMTEIISSSII